MSSVDLIINLFNIESNECTRIHDENRKLVRCVKSAPGNIIIKGNLDGSVKIGNTIIDAHTKSVKGILILSKNKFITYSWDKTIKLFDLDTFECIRTLIGHESYVKAIDKISTDKIVSCSSRSIKIWNLDDGLCLKAISDYPTCLNVLKVISETEIACDSGYDIKILNINSGICLKTLEGHSACIGSIIHLSKEQIASSAENGEIKIWNINNGECLRTFEAYTDKACYLVKLTRNSIISFAVVENKIKIWNTDTGNCLKIIQTEDRRGLLEIDLF